MTWLFPNQGGLRKQVIGQRQGILNAHGLCCHYPSDPPNENQIDCNHIQSCSSFIETQHNNHILTYGTHAKCHQDSKEFIPMCYTTNRTNVGPLQVFNHVLCMHLTYVHPHSLTRLSKSIVLIFPTFEHKVFHILLCGKRQLFSCFPTMFISRSFDMRPSVSKNVLKGDPPPSMYIARYVFPCIL